MSLRIGSVVASLSLPCLLAACASTDKPTIHMIYASASLKGAERSQSEKRSPDLFRRAESAYWKATRLFLAKEYEDARAAAVEARRLAEAAEMDSELKEAQSDGG